MKTTIEIKDKNTVIIDGEEYIRRNSQFQEKADNSTWHPKFKTGDWVRILNYDTGLDQQYEEANQLCKVCDFDDKECVYLLKTATWEDYGRASKLRLATPSEIKSHLRKICDEKYVGKRVRCLFDGEIFTITKFWDMNEFNEVVYHTKSSVPVGHEDGCWVYRNDNWAEIIPDKKPVPKTREEFVSMFADFESYDKPITGVEEFLDQYDFKE